MWLVFQRCCYGLLLHGESELGWRGFVLVMLGLAVLIVMFNEAAARVLQGKRKKKRPRQAPYRRR